MSYPPELDFKVITANPPSYIKHMIICILESIFTEETLYNDIPNPFKIVMNEEGEVQPQSRLTVADSFSRDLAQVDTRPIVVVKRGPLSFSKLYLGDGLNGGGIGAPSGASQFMDHLTVSIIISSYSRNKVETEDLAWLCSLFLETFKYEIQKFTAYEKMFPPTTGEPVPVDVSSEFDYFKADVTLGFVLPFSWEITRTDAENNISNVLSRFYADYANNIPFYDGHKITDPINSCKLNHPSIGDE